MDPLALDQLLDHFFTESINIERAPVRKMPERLFALRRANQLAGAARDRFAGQAFDFRTAHRAMRHISKRRASAGRRANSTFTTSGITSPARRTVTVSPIRISLRRISSSLCSVACVTVA